MTTLEQQNSIPCFTVPVMPQRIDAGLQALPLDSKVSVRTESCADFGSGVTTATDAIAEIKRTMARQSKGHFTMAEAADVLAAANGFDAYDFLRDRMHPAFTDGNLILVDPKDGLPVSGRLCMQFHDWATPANVNEWLKHVDSPYLWPVPQAAPVITGIETAKPLQRCAAQEAAILAAIRKAGHDPLAMPARDSGKAGVKAGMRAALEGVNTLFPKGSRVFDKAWERLLQQGGIVNCPTLPGGVSP
jgi:hypothetical protein